uniref:Uncharacterized protein LOC114913895 n=1 Tax=Elaeis guineensis var. tenera TaxID=51953 RepID=A0A8N4EW32_ELAGV|nr:uncharacterized protein LOC114913895 [Elaeis guineensis]
MVRMFLTPHKSRRLPLALEDLFDVSLFGKQLLVYGHQKKQKALLDAGSGSTSNTEENNTNQDKSKKWHGEALLGEPREKKDRDGRELGHVRMRETVFRRVRACGKKRIE